MSEHPSRSWSQGLRTTDALSTFALVLAVATFALLAITVTGNAPPPAPASGFCPNGCGVCRHDPCPGQPKKPVDSCSHAAWDNYKRQLHAIEGLWAQADAIDSAALEEFAEQIKDLYAEMGMGAALDAPIKAVETAIQAGELTEAAALEGKMLDAAARVDEDAAALFQNHLAANELQDASSAANAGGALTTGVGAVAQLIDMGMWITMAHSAVGNLQQSTQAQESLLNRADTLWPALLAATAAAMAKDSACASDQQKLKDAQALQKRAENYVQDLEVRVLNADGTEGSEWTIGNRTYTNVIDAVNAAKQHLSATGQSGAIEPGSPWIRFASYATTSVPSDTAALSPAMARQLLAILKPVGPNLKAAWDAFTSIAVGYVDIWGQIHAFTGAINDTQ
jgi:hypothetical protein